MTSVTSPRRPKILEQCIVKKEGQGYVSEATRKLSNGQNYIYKKLYNGMEFGGTLDDMQDGLGTIVNYNEQQYYQQCQVKSGIVVKYKARKNLVTNDIISDDIDPPSNQTDDIRFDKLVQRLKFEYLSRQIDHKVVVFSTCQTGILLDIQTYKKHESLNIQSHLKSKKQEYKNLISCYKNFIQIWTYFSKQLDFIVLVQNNKAFIFISKQVNQKLKIYIQKFLDNVGYIVTVKQVYKSKRIDIFKSSIMGGSNQINSFLNKSGIMNNNNKNSITQCIPSQRGYFTILILLKLFSTNGFDNQVLKYFDGLISNYHNNQQEIKQKVQALASNKIVVFRLENIFKLNQNKKEEFRNQFRNFKKN